MAAYSNGASPRSDPNGASVSRLQRFLRLLHPGVGLKRWALIGAIGVAFCSIGLAYLIRKFFSVGFPDFLPWYFEGFLLLGVGGGAILLSMYGYYRALSPLFMRSKSIDAVADTVYNRWSRGRGPKVVAIGGGHRSVGAAARPPTSHRQSHCHNHRRGRWRQLRNTPARAWRASARDFRNCLVALSEDETLLADLFQYRFDEGSGLKGHSFGNLFIVAMTNVTESFDQALVESSRVLAVRGGVLPSTSADLRLSARFSDGTVVLGESSITDHGGHIERLMIEPASAPAHPLAVQAIEEADIVVIGPGSLYTSILPNILVGGISDALARTNATVVYVCNVATQVGETDSYSVRDHVEALHRHTFDDIADYVLANSDPVPLDERFAGQPVFHDGQPIPHAKVVLTDMADPTHPVRHDADKLASAIMEVHASANGRRRGAVELQSNSV